MSRATARERKICPIKACLCYTNARAVVPCLAVVTEDHVFLSHFFSCCCTCSTEGAHFAVWECVSYERLVIISLFSWNMFNLLFGSYKHCFVNLLVLGSVQSGRRGIMWFITLLCPFDFTHIMWTVALGVPKHGHGLIKVLYPSLSISLCCWMAQPVAPASRRTWISPIEWIKHLEP